MRHFGTAGLVAAAALAADQASKAWVRAIAAHEGHIRDVIPGCFALVYRTNPGIAFSLFRSVKAAPFIFSLVSLAAVAFVAWTLCRYRCLPYKILLALGAIAGGALGNMIDRLVPPHRVLDFIDWYIGACHWPAFNIADSAICIGACLLVLASFTDPHAFSTSAPPKEDCHEKR